MRRATISEGVSGYHFLIVLLFWILHQLSPCRRNEFSDPAQEGGGNQCTPCPWGDAIVARRGLLSAQGDAVLMLVDYSFALDFSLTLHKTKFVVQHRFESGWVFPLQRPALIQNTTPTQNLSTPTFGSQNRHIQIPPTYFRLDVPLLEVQPSEDVPSMSTTSMSTNSIMPFHNVDPKLLHWVS